MEIITNHREEISLKLREKFEVIDNFSPKIENTHSWRDLLLDAAHMSSLLKNKQEDFNLSHTYYHFSLKWPENLEKRKNGIDLISVIWYQTGAWFLRNFWGVTREMVCASKVLQEENNFD